MTWRIDDMSYSARTASGSCIIRCIWVGTIWTSVTRCRSISRSAPWGSQWSIRTTVCSKLRAKNPNESGARWYIGDVTRWTASPPGWMSYRVMFELNSSIHCSGVNVGSARWTAFGRPVVPDVYCMNWPPTRSIGIGGRLDGDHVLQPGEPGDRAPTDTAGGIRQPVASAASMATWANASSATRTLAPESSTM